MPTIVPSTAFLLERLLDVAPHAELLRLLTRQNDAAFFIVGALEVDFDVVALMNADRAVALAELVNADLPFGFVSDVDGDVVTRDEDDASTDDLPRFDRAHALLEHSGEVVTSAESADALVVFVFGHQLHTPWDQDLLFSSATRRLP